MANPDAAAGADMVVLSVPCSAQQSTVQNVAARLQGKILIGVTVPLVPAKFSRVQLPEGSSAVEAVQKAAGRGRKGRLDLPEHLRLPPRQHRRGNGLRRTGLPDDPAAADQVVALSEEIGLTAWNAGPLANSAAAEALTSLLIPLNRRYKLPAAGMHITGRTHRGVSSFSYSEATHSGVLAGQGHSPAPVL